MKISNKILTTTFFGLLFFSFSLLAYVRMNTTEGHTITREGPTTTKTISMKYFKSIEASTGRLTLVEGEPKVTVTCAENIHEYINTKSNDGNLSIGIVPGSYENIGFIDIEVSARDLSSIKLYSDVQLRSDKSFKVDELTILAAHGSSIELTVEANTINATSKDSGKMTLRGSSNLLNAYAKNSGNLHASELVANEVVATVSDAGQLLTSVEKIMEVFISNAGQVMYKGNPEIKTKAISEAGQLTKL